MTVTDVFIHPFPEGDSTLQRMALTARECGFDTLIAVHHHPCEYHGVRILQGILVNEGTMKTVMSAIRQNRRAIIGVAAGDANFNRNLLKTQGVHLITDLHRSQRNAFDQVSAKLAAGRRVAIHLDISQIISCRGHSRQKVLTRYAELLTLQRKFGFSFAIGSGARSILGQRSVREIILLTALFGMTKEETIDALGTVPELYQDTSLPRVVV
ncbi:ribonuclease P [Methanocalculus taiwanensis]|uniref:Ribonuclease P protein component 3 n=1 Tax=Methanocalculus taiwanensis TaxID=106207 RepID=A0ABD4TM92_9EURY|nr:RNase P subunit p30 family protein [Methanocalculus taiwanensis]MCQ1538410.1 ribonuclease P [Methanocalculus taiwanensis]